LSTITIADAALLYVIETVAVGAFMITYAYVTHKGNNAYKNNIKGKFLRVGSGSILIANNLYITLRG